MRREEKVFNGHIYKFKSLCVSILFVYPAWGLRDATKALGFTHLAVTHMV